MLCDGMLCYAMLSVQCYYSIYHPCRATYMLNKISIVLSLNRHMDQYKVYSEVVGIIIRRFKLNGESRSHISSAEDLPNATKKTALRTVVFIENG